MIVGIFPFGTIYGYVDGKRQSRNTFILGIRNILLSANNLTVKR